MRHIALIEDAKDAISKVFGDKSVSPATTLDGMEELLEYIEADIDALKLMLDDEDDLEANR